MPTPAVAFLTEDMRCDIGIMISASHNPYYDNGIKFFDLEKVINWLKRWSPRRIGKNLPVLNYQGNLLGIKRKPKKFGIKKEGIWVPASKKGNLEWNGLIWERIINGFQLIKNLPFPPKEWVNWNLPSFQKLEEIPLN